MTRPDPAILSKAAPIQLVLFDVDGVLTDGRLYFDEEGHKLKSFYSRDGYGLRMLIEADIHVGVISGHAAHCVERRCQDLGIPHILLGIVDKRAAFEGLLQQLGLRAEQTAFVGDDLIDLPVMSLAGLAIAVADADPFVAAHADWITPHEGGRGAVRDVCEMVLEAKGLLGALRQRALERCLCKMHST